MDITKLKAKHYKRWTKEELNLLRSPLSSREIANKLNRSLKTIETNRSRMGIKISEPKVPKPESTVKEDLEEKDEDYWARQYGMLNVKYQKLLKAENAVERLVTRIVELAPRRYAPAPAIIRSVRKPSGQPQSAVLMFSDTHIGKTTSPDQTLSFGNYNFSMFLARLKYLEEAVISISEHHVTTHVPELVIAMLGDMLDGTLAHSNEAGQLDPIFNQFYCGAHAIAQFFRNLAPHFPKIRIYDVVGNHSRFQNQKHMPTRNRYSNFDKFLYALVRELIRDIKNIEWKLDAQPYQLFEVQGFTFFTAHGDTLRGGDKTLGVPNHAVGRLVSTATQMLNKYNRKAPNYYLVGHLHRDIVLPHATGSFLVNGGFPGVDEFGLSEMFTPADASQKFFFIHSVYGKTATYDISLKFAEPTQKSPYTIPSEFLMT
jgi:hypothetical protein